MIAIILTWTIWWKRCKTPLTLKRETTWSLAQCTTLSSSLEMSFKCSNLQGVRAVTLSTCFYSTTSASWTTSARQQKKDLRLRSLHPNHLWTVYIKSALWLIKVLWRPGPQPGIRRQTNKTNLNTSISSLMESFSPSLFAVYVTLVELFWTMLPTVLLSTTLTSL